MLGYGCPRHPTRVYYKDFMITNGSGDTTADTVEFFKGSNPPAILVSPSVVTGYDFPGEEAEWQVIGKIPFADSRSLIMKARQRRNADYGCYLALKQMVQASGRIVRTPEDVGETFVIDDHFKWVVSKYRGVIPKWWLEAVQTRQTIPEV